MTTMAEAGRASEALRKAAEGGGLEGSLLPAVFGCPYCRTARIVTSPLPFGRCGRCATQMTILDAEQMEQAIRRAG